MQKSFAVPCKSELLAIDSVEESCQLLHMPETQHTVHTGSYKGTFLAGKSEELATGGTQSFQSDLLHDDVGYEECSDEVITLLMEEGSYGFCLVAETDEERQGTKGLIDTACP